MTCSSLGIYSIPVGKLASDGVTYLLSLEVHSHFLGFTDVQSKLISQTLHIALLQPPAMTVAAFVVFVAWISSKAVPGFDCGGV